MPSQGLNARNVVITGATKNIGLAVSRAFAEAGASLVIAARSKDVLDEVAAELRDRGAPQVIPVAADITSPIDLEKLSDTALESLGGVDVLVNNALVDMGHDPILEAPHEVWQRGLTGYLLAPLQLISAFAPSMRERGHGAVVNMVSTAAFVPVAGLGAYGVTKSAMWTLTKYLAAELAPDIRVNAVCPGTTSADGTTSGNANWEKLIAKVPLRRMATPDETAQSVLFLASDASSYTTGQVIFVDGGRVSLT